MLLSLLIVHTLLITLSLTPDRTHAISTNQPNRNENLLQVNQDSTLTTEVKSMRLDHFNKRLLRNYIFIWSAMPPPKLEIGRITRREAPRESREQ